MTQLPPTSAVRRVLVVDDQSDIREALRLLLKSAGFASHMADSPGAAISAVASSEIDLIVLDMNYTSDTTSGQEGILLLDRLRGIKPEVPIIAMTGWSTIELAVKAMQHGACDFVTKPWDAYQLVEVFEKHLGAGKQKREAVSAREAEVALAQRVQQRLLPPQSLLAGGLQFDCAFLPAGEVGGDVYDFFDTGAGGVAFLLGDVCGKGLGAALLVATLQAAIRSQQELASDPRRLLERVNRLFFQSTRPEHYATLFFGVFERDRNRIRYVNCGHPAAILVRCNGKTESLDAGAMVLGAFESSEFPEQTVEFYPGDRLVLFSDGVTESSVSEADDDWTLKQVQRFSHNFGLTLAVNIAKAAVPIDERAPDDITVMDVRYLLMGNGTA